MCEIHSTYIVYHLFKTYMEKDHFECCSRIVIHSLSHIYTHSHIQTYTHTYTHKHTHIHSNFWEAEIVGFSISLSTQRDRHALGRLASFYGSDDFNWFPSSFFSSYHIHLEQNKCYYFKIDWNRLSRVLKNVYDHWWTACLS